MILFCVLWSFIAFLVHSPPIHIWSAMRVVCDVVHKSLSRLCIMLVRWAVRLGIQEGFAPVNKRSEFAGLCMNDLVLGVTLIPRRLQRDLLSTMTLIWSSCSSTRTVKIQKRNFLHNPKLYAWKKSCLIIKCVLQKQRMHMFKTIIAQKNYNSHVPFFGTIKHTLYCMTR